MTYERRCIRCIIRRRESSPPFLQPGAGAERTERSGARLAPPFHTRMVYISFGVSRWAVAFGYKDSVMLKFSPTPVKLSITNWRLISWRSVAKPASLHLVTACHQKVSSSM
jgi:hypothetical protein